MNVPAAKEDRVVPWERADWSRLASELRRADSFARPTPTPCNLNWPAHRNGKPPLVLIVDDDPAIRMLCSVSLQIEGLVVLEAPDGRTALEQARARCPDLVLTDVMMPGLDGFQLAEALRRDKRTHSVPLIFISGEPRTVIEARADELGAFAYLAKPFDPAALSLVVASALAHTAMRERAAGARRKGSRRLNSARAALASPRRDLVDV